MGGWSCGWSCDWSCDSDGASNGDRIFIKNVGSVLDQEGIVYDKINVSNEIQV